jgi:hypothetical protein
MPRGDLVAKGGQRGALVGEEGREPALSSSCIAFLGALDFLKTRIFTEVVFPSSQFSPSKSQR